jgi:uncharacterized protein YndB with AHSA1/START domain
VSSLSSDRIAVTTLVAVPPARAFAVFTEQVDAWWKHGQRFRTGAPGESVMRFEPGVGGRLLETFDASADPFELGRVTAWEPPRRLVFDMGGRALAPGEKTEVEIRFEPVPNGTRVTVEHRGWDAFAPDHPVRHGFDGTAFRGMIGVFWTDLLVAHRTRCERGEGGKSGPDRRG